MFTSNVVAATRRISMRRLGMLQQQQLPQQLKPPSHIHANTNTVVLFQCRTMAFQKPFVRT